MNGEITVHLPRTAGRRGAITYLQVLTGIAPRPAVGFGLEGRYFRSGAWVKEEELLGGIAVECSEIAGESHGARRGRSWEALYIVWRWDRGAGLWEEIARTSGERSLVMAELRAIAARALGQITWRIVPSVEAAAARIRDGLERQLAGVEREQRAAVLAILHDQVAAWMVED